VPCIRRDVSTTAEDYEGTNSTYCHPRKEAVDALTAALGGAGAGVIHAFPSSVTCSASTAGALWVDEHASDKLWATARDGDVVLTTTGMGRSRESDAADFRDERRTRER
jgi:hypothetical protein